MKLLIVAFLALNFLNLNSCGTSTQSNLNGTPEEDTVVRQFREAFQKASSPESADEFKSGGYSCALRSALKGSFDSKYSLAVVLNHYGKVVNISNIPHTFFAREENGNWHGINKVDSSFSVATLRALHAGIILEISRPIPASGRNTYAPSLVYADKMASEYIYCNKQ